VSSNRWILFAVLFSGAATSGYCDIVSTDTFGGHTYYMLEASTWASGEAGAAVLGGHLATIDSASENEFVRATFANTLYATSVATAQGRCCGTVWIGLNDEAVEGVFAWSSGAPVTYTNWRPSEPNNAGNNEDFVELYDVGGGWNDINALVLNPSIVEVESAVPEPGYAVGIGAVLTLLMAMGRRSNRGRKRSASIR
jgi:lectin-like protein